LFITAFILHAFKRNAAVKANHAMACLLYFPERKMLPILESFIIRKKQAEMITLSSFPVHQCIRDGSFGSAGLANTRLTA